MPTNLFFFVIDENINMTNDKSICRILLTVILLLDYGYVVSHIHKIKIKLPDLSRSQGGCQFINMTGVGAVSGAGAGLGAGAEPESEGGGGSGSGTEQEQEQEQERRQEQRQEQKRRQEQE